MLDSATRVQQVPADLGPFEIEPFQVSVFSGPVALSRFGDRQQEEPDLEFTTGLQPGEDDSPGVIVGEHDPRRCVDLAALEIGPERAYKYSTAEVVTEAVERVDLMLVERVADGMDGPLVFDLHRPLEVRLGSSPARETEPSIDAFRLAEPSRVDTTKGIPIRTTLIPLELLDEMQARRVDRQLVLDRRLDRDRRRSRDRAFRRHRALRWDVRHLWCGRELSDRVRDRSSTPSEHEQHGECRETTRLHGDLPRGGLELAGSVVASGLVVLEDLGVRGLALAGDRLQVRLADHMVGPGHLLPLMFATPSYMALGDFPVAPCTRDHRSQKDSDAQKSECFPLARHDHYRVADPLDSDHGCPRATRDE